MNHIICVIDRSGSMGSMLEEAIGGFNAFLDEQRADGTDDVLTYCHFDHDFETLCTRKPIGEVESLGPETYQPRGMTALYDAIGKAINEADERRSDTTILLVLTDGHENTSKTFNKASVRKLIEEKESEGWQVVYAGPELNAFDEAASLGIKAANTIGYEVSGEGLTDAYGTSSKTVSSYKQ